MTIAASLPGTTLRYRAAILTALQLEYDAILRLLERIETRTNALDATPYRVGFLASKRDPSSIEWEVAVVLTGDGQTATVSESQLLFLDFKPHVAAFVGVAGGRPSKVEHGDVVVGSELVYYESGKDRSRRLDDHQFQFRPKIHYPSRLLKKAAEFEAYEGRWQDRCAVRPNAKVHIEPIASGEKVVASDSGTLWRSIESQFDKVVAVEMEGHGFHFAQHAHNVLGIVIRGISDLLTDKNEKGEQADREFQIVAANNAAAFTIELLSNLAADVAFGAAGEVMEENIVVIITLDAPRERTGVILRSIADVTVDRSVRLRSVSVGSITLTLETTGHAGALLYAIWRGNLINLLLGFKVLSVASETVRTGDKPFDAAMTAIADLGTAAPAARRRASDAIQELALVRPAWRHAFVKITEAISVNPSRDSVPEYFDPRDGVTLRGLGRIMASLVLPRKVLSYAAGVSSNTVARAIKGERIRYLTARHIVDALNEFMKKSGKAELSLDDLLGEHHRAYPDG